MPDSSGNPVVNDTLPKFTEANNEKGKERRKRETQTV
jgi:hypothetical protein